jgi:hypothetical protein
VTLDAATLEWIRRLPDQPGPRERSALRLLRRQATTESERRLLDSLVASADDSTSKEQGRHRLEQRVETMRRQVEATQFRHTDTMARRLASAMQQSLGLPPHTALERAKRAIDQRHHQARERTATAIAAAEQNLRES